MPVHHDTRMTADSLPKKGPLIAFGCGGLLGAYYVGTVSFIRDHFDLIESNISLSGVSCGTFAAFVIFFELSLSQSFKYISMLNAFFLRRTLRILFNKIKPSMDFMYNTTVSLFNKKDVDQHMKVQYHKFKSIYFGCSCITLNQRYLPSLKKVLPGCNEQFASVFDVLYSMSVSTRTMPFYLWFGKIKNEPLCFDGGATQNFAISDTDAKDRAIITISAFSRNSKYNICGPTDVNTICPDIEMWTIKDAMSLGDLNESIRRYKIGYLTAAKAVHVMTMLKKGLIWCNDFHENDICDEEKWNNHIEDCMNDNIQILKHELNLVDVDKTRRKDFVNKPKLSICAMVIGFLFCCVYIVI